MIRTVQTIVIYCFGTRDEKACMSPVVFKIRKSLIQTSGKIWHFIGPGQMLQRKTWILLTTNTMNIMNK